MGSQRGSHILAAVPLDACSVGDNDVASCTAGGWMTELPTVGVEEEFLLVDPRTGEPVPHNAAVAAEAEPAASPCSWK